MKVSVFTKECQGMLTLLQDDAMPSSATSWLSISCANHHLVADSVSINAAPAHCGEHTLTYFSQALIIAA